MVIKLELATYSKPEIHKTICGDETVPDICVLWSFGFRKIVDESVQEQGLAHCEHNKNESWKHWRE
jgi:hypothetical protein